MKCVHKLFDYIEAIQILYTKLRIKLHILQRSCKYEFIRKIYIFVIGIAILSFIVALYFQNVTLAYSFAILILGLILIVPIIKSLLNCLTSIRYFICVSIFFNLFTGILIFTDNIIFVLFLFLLVYTFLSILANTDVAKTVNAIIEFILTLSTLARDLITDLADFICNELIKQGIINDPSIIQNISNMDEYEFRICVDLVLIPLLIINGIALLVSVLHSYWIKKYNAGSELKLINFEDLDIKSDNIND